MAKDELLFNFKAVGHDKLKGAIDKTNDSLDKMNKKGKGMLRNNRLLENSFATMRSHLLLFNFAMGLGIRQLINFSKQSAKLQSMEKAFDNLSGGSGRATIAIKKLQIATGSTMSSMDLFKQANAAMTLGVTKNADEMSEMFRIAKRLGRALGVDTERSIESLVTGLGRQSVKMLDNIGIIVKSNEAYEDYAKANNLVASELTDAEKRQAFFTAALESARKKIKSLGPETKSAQDSFDKFGATIENLATGFGGLITPKITKMLDSFSDWVDSLNDGPMETLVKSLSKAGVEVERFSFLMDELAKEEARKELIRISEDSADLLDNLKELAGEEGALSFIRSFGGELQNLQFSSVSKMNEAFQDLNSITLRLTGAIPKPIQDMFGLGDSFDDMSGKALDFSKINESQLTNALEQSSHALEQFTILADKEQKALGAVTKSTVNNIEAQTKTHSMLLLLAGAHSEYITQLNISKGIIEDNNQAQNNNNNTLIINEDLLKRLEEAYKKTTEAQILKLEADIKEAELLKAKGELNPDQLKGLDAMIEKTDKLKKSLEKKTEVELKDLKWTEFSFNQKLTFASKLAKASSDLIGINKKNALASARLDQSAAIINTYTAVTDVLKEGTGPMRYAEAAIAFAYGMKQVAAIEAQLSNMGGGGGAVGKFEHGGLVGGRPHSQGGTIIEAERGEFVMSRNAVESIGLETLNMMNEGGGGAVNITVTGNVMTQDFVEGELAESIKEAVRRGSDFGIG